MKKLLALIALLGCLLLAVPASAASLAGYWKGPISMTLKHSTYTETTKVREEVKIAFDGSGDGSFRYTRDSDTSYMGYYSKSGSRLSFIGEDDAGNVILFQNMSMKLSGNRLTLKGRFVSNAYYATNAVISLSRINPTIKSIKSNKVACGDETTITVKTDQFIDCVYLTDVYGDVLDCTSERLSGNTFKLRYSFPNKTNKVKILATMTTRDGFTFRSATKSATVKCK